MAGVTKQATNSALRDAALMDYLASSMKSDLQSTTSPATLAADHVLRYRDRFVYNGTAASITTTTTVSGGEARINDLIRLGCRELFA